MTQAREARLFNVSDVRVSTVDKHTNEGEQAVRLCNYVDVYKNEVILNDFDFMPATCTPDEIARFRLAPGDVVFTKDSETADDIGIPAFVKTSAPDLVCGYHVAIATPHQDLVDPKFLFWYLNSRLAFAWWETRASGVTRMGLRQEDIRHLRLGVLPPLAHQQTIANFLDRETAQIDAMIEAQTNLVSLLNERLDSATNRSVLGLDGEPMVGVSHSERVRYAPRGLPHLATELALNEVPDHWSVYRFKNCVDRVERRNEMEAADLMSLTSQGLVVPRTETGDRQQPAPESVPRYLLVAPGDLVVNPMWLIGGAVGVSTREGAVSPDYRVFSIDTDRIEPRYLHHLLRSTPYQHQYTLFARANTTFDRRIQQADLDNLAIPVPPLAEQRRIARTIDETMRQGDALVQAANTTVGLLRERRDALIAAAVTGRIDPTTGSERIDPTTEKEAS